MADDRNFKKLIKSCRSDNRNAQKELYKTYYSFAMQICSRYTQTLDDAKEAMNDGFMKVFGSLKNYDLDRPFQPWLRQIMVRTAIDHFHKNNPKLDHIDMETGMSQSAENQAIDKVSYEEVLEIIRKLPPMYQTVFNLYAIEGFKHSEIAEMLNISEGTSKSNYARAREKLRLYLEKYFEVS